MLSIEAGIEEAGRATPGVLGSIQREVSPRHQTVAGISVFGRQRDADADADDHAMSVDVVEGAGDLDQSNAPSRPIVWRRMMMNSSPPSQASVSVSRTQAATRSAA